MPAHAKCKDLALKHAWRAVSATPASNSACRFPGLRSVAALAVALAAWQTQTAQGTGVERGSNRYGRQDFVSLCSGCHGLDGKGAERAPNIAADPNVQRLNDTAITNIISEGIAGTAMPPFHTLGASRIQSILLYLRQLQGNKKSSNSAGDPIAGKRIFFGEGQCSSCHMVEGVGGFLGPDLSVYGASHSAEETLSAILEPSRNLGGKKSAVTATTLDRTLITGIVRNEDNFSIQLQTENGAFYFLKKSDLQGLDGQSRSLMPSDYGQKLRPQQLQDLASYLARSAEARKQDRKKKEGQP